MEHIPLIYYLFVLTFPKILPFSANSFNNNKIKILKMSCFLFQILGNQITTSDIRTSQSLSLFAERQVNVNVYSCHGGWGVSDILFNASYRDLHI